MSLRHHARPGPRRTIVAALAALACLGGTLAGAGAAPAPARAPAPDPASPAPGTSRLLPAPAGGERAVRLLGGRLEEAAARNDLTATALVDLLTGDPTVRVDERGRVLFRDLDPHRPEPAEAPDAAREAQALAAPFPDDQTFALHSLPGSRRTIYLDVDGGTVAGTAWNDASFPDGAVTGYDLDGDPSTFSPAERAVVQVVWQRVAEDFAPFDVDVTTEAPAPGRIDRSGEADQEYGTVAMITGDPRAHAAICGDPGCTGVAYLDVFDATRSHARYQPAWAFTAYYDDVASIAETVSHEVGHTLSLHHDGWGTEDYYGGHGLWGPIMGSTGRPVVQWSQGSYAGATTTEDDLALIATHGLPLRADEAGADIATAAAAPPAGPAYVTTREDVDVFALGPCTGPVSVTGATALASPDLDLELSLLDASGATLATADPLVQSVQGRLTGMGATVSLAVTDEPLWVAVDGVGAGGWSTDYDDYGSLGSYVLSVLGDCATGAQQPDPDPVEVTAPGAPAVDGVRPGRSGRPLTLAVRWTPSVDDGGSAVTGWRVAAQRLDGDGAVVRSSTGPLLAPERRRTSLRLGAGRYRLAVTALNAQGASPLSAWSRVVRPR
ncbi:hypothetical protein [Nocardioides kribbensis]|uniref:hypothetical protein n=1 Tax=Nocardioides kribbensis TaxID=305517 RepID=UPI00187A2474|nr:hypothetical protein [Nocardioides kribbensis]